MTEADFIESYTALLNGGLASVGIYLTTVSGFLIVAYMAGRKLRRSQFFIISALFVSFSSLMAFTAYSLVQRAVALEIAYEGVTDALDRGPYVLMTLLVLGIVASLKFMWDIRTQS